MRAAAKKKSDDGSLLSLSTERERQSIPGRLLALSLRALAPFAGYRANSTYLQGRKTKSKAARRRDRELGNDQLSFSSFGGRRRRHRCSFHSTCLSISTDLVPCLEHGVPVRLDVVVLSRHDAARVCFSFEREREKKQRKLKEEAKVVRVESGRIESKKKKELDADFHRKLFQEAEAEGDFDRSLLLLLSLFSSAMAEHLASLFGTEKDRVNVRFSCVWRERERERERKKRELHSTTTARGGGGVFRPPLLSSFASPPPLSSPLQLKKNFSARSTSRSAPAGTGTAAPERTISPRSPRLCSSTTSGAAPPRKPPPRPPPRRRTLDSLLHRRNRRRQRKSAAPKQISRISTRKSSKN